VTTGPVAAPEISPIRPDELDAVSRIVIDTYADVGFTIHPEYGAELVDVARRVSDPNVVVLVARLDGRPVGHAAVVLGPSPMADHVEPEASSLRMVAVLPTVQGHGVGRALIVEAMAVARRAGRTTMRLYTQPMMHAAQHIYESLGFVRVPERDAYIARHEMTLIAYEASLAASGSQG
jgi:ribosomal protein S18 acetylase RimI-like enzyme